MTITRHRYTPTDARLGRHVKHDSRSLNYTFAAPASTTIKSVDWPVNGTLDQGQIGSCTGNALAQWLNTDFAQAALKAKRPAVARLLTEKDALAFYSLATKLDNAPGQYPPTDTGSDGLDVCKAGVQLGYLSGYQHVLSFNDLLLALQHTPVIVGTEWLKNMFTPIRSSDVLQVTGAVEGGHEYLIRGVDIDKRLITMHNSWAASWGKNGDAYITFSSFEKLLAAQGDITVPII